jgi:hypothetical protein
MSGRPPRASALKARELVARVAANTVSKPRGVKRPRGNNNQNYASNSRNPKRPAINVSNVTDPVTLMIGAKMAGKLTGNKPVKLVILNNILTYMSDNQKMYYPNMTDPEVISKESRSIVIKMNNIESVYLFLFNLFCDQIHDSTNDLGLMKKRLKITGLSDPVYIFNRYIQNVVWLDNAIKQELKTVDGKYKQLVTDTFTISNRSTDYRLDESMYTYKSLELLKGISPNLPLPFKHTSSVPIGYSGFPSVTPMISFDQTSKAAGRAAITPTTTTALKAAANPLYVVSLPVVSDLGAAQPSNPLGQFYENLKIVIDMVQGEPNILNSRNDKIDALLTKRYILLENKEFTSTITYKNKIVLKTRLYINRDGLVLANVTKPNIPNGVLNGKILSASNMTKQSNISEWIFKTIGDLNILLVAIASQSAALTGDRMAGGFYMLFSFLKDRKWLTIDKNKNIMFLFEGGGPTDIVVTNNFRTNDSQDYLNYLTSKRTKTRVERQNIEPRTRLTRNRDARNMRDITLNRFVAVSGSSINRERYMHAKKLLTGASYRQFESLVNSKNTIKKTQLLSTIKRFPLNKNVKPSDEIQKQFYKILANVPTPTITNNSNENIPKVTKNGFIKTLNAIGIGKNKVTKITSKLTAERSTYYANILKGVTPSSTIVRTINELESNNKLNSILTTVAIKNSVDKLYRNVPEMSFLKDEAKLDKFNQWLKSGGNTPYLQQFVNIKRIQSVPAITDLKRNLILAITLLGNNQRVNTLVFGTIKELLEYGQS